MRACQWYCGPAGLRKLGSNWRSSPDLSHLGGAEAARVGKDAQAVAAIVRRSEHIDELELHRHDATGTEGRH